MRKDYAWKLQELLPTHCYQRFLKDDVRIEANQKGSWPIQIHEQCLADTLPKVYRNASGIQTIYSTWPHHLCIASNPKWEWSTDVNRCEQMRTVQVAGESCGCHPRRRPSSTARLGRNHRQANLNWCPGDSKVTNDIKWQCHWGIVRLLDDYSRSIELRTTYKWR